MPKPEDPAPVPVRLTRRRLLGAGAAAPLATAAAAAAVATHDLREDVPWREGAADAPKAISTDGGYSFFTPAEAAFIEAAVARLIPADDLGPGAKEVGVPLFIDRQLAGDYGRGGRWYMQGPWGEGLPTQGWQTRMTPAGLYRAALREIDQAVSQAHRGTPYARLGAGDQDAWLKRLEQGEPQLPTADAKTFFQLLWQNTIEGYWADPIYGGNRDMAGWKLIGFPGARYDHSPYVRRHNERYPLPPVGLAGRPEWQHANKDGNKG